MLNLMLLTYCYIAAIVGSQHMLDQTHVLAIVRLLPPLQDSTSLPVYILTFATSSTGTQDTSLCISASLRRLVTIVFFGVTYKYPIILRKS